MPTDKIHPERVDFTEMLNGLKRYLVSGTYTDGRMGMFQATTISPYAASLCQRSVEKGYDVLIQWRDVRGGKGITYVELAPEDEQGAA